MSVADVVVLTAGTVAALLAAQFVWWAAFVIAFVIGHFFLFCNVFRVSRALELSWAVLFAALSALTILFDAPGWTATAAVSLGMAIAVILFEMRKPSYHGIGWSRINPGLQARR